MITLFLIQNIFVKQRVIGEYSYEVYKYLKHLNLRILKKCFNIS